MLIERAPGIAALPAASFAVAITAMVAAPPALPLLGTDKPTLDEMPLVGHEEPVLERIESIAMPLESIATPRVEPTVEQLDELVRRPDGMDLGQSTLLVHVPEFCTSK